MLVCCGEENGMEVWGLWGDRGRGGGFRVDGDWRLRGKRWEAGLEYGIVVYVIL
jgi:hypothetical protein